MTSLRVTTATQSTMLTCPQCQHLFAPTKQRQTFCKPRCRALYSKEHGLQGEVAGVTRLLHGVSIVLHFKGPAEEKAVRLLKRQMVRLVVEP